MNLTEELKLEVLSRKRNGFIKKYFCDKCDYSGCSQHHVKRHKIAYHERLNKCDQCDFHAPWPAKLLLHQQVKHEGFKFDCDQCELKFTTDSNLKTHQGNKHKGI